MGPKNKKNAAAKNNASRSGKRESHGKSASSKGKEEDIQPNGPAPKKLPKNFTSNIKLKEGKIEDVVKHRQAGVEGALAKVQYQNPEVVTAAFRGTEAHQSHQDPDEKQQIVSMRLFKNDEATEDSFFGTMHVRENGTGSIKLKDTGEFVEIGK